MTLPSFRPPTPRRTITATLAVAAVLIGTAVGAPVSASADPTTDAAAVPAGRFIPLTPTRVLDTRTSGGSFHSGESRVVDTGKAFNATASAVVVNLTIVTPSGSGFAAVYPAGLARPAASTLNFVKNESRANLVTVAVGTGSLQDRITVWLAADGGQHAHVVVDVLGYYGAGGVGAPAGTTYQPLRSTVRIFDTRSSIGPLTNTYPRNTGQVKIDYGSPTVNKTISAVAMTITVTQPKSAGYLQLWNGLGPPPHASSLSWVANQSIGNLAIIPVRCSTSACNTVEFAARNNGSPSTQLVGDISGMYAKPSASGLLFRPHAPVRITDTRTRMGYGTLPSRGTGVTTVSSAYAGAGTKAIAMNMQAVKPSLTTWLTSWPTGVTKPPVTNLNARAGKVDAIAAQVMLSGARQFSTTAYWGPTDVVIDLSGTFVSDPTAASSTSVGTATATVDGSVSGT